MKYKLQLCMLMALSFFQIGCHSDDDENGQSHPIMIQTQGESLRNNSSIEISGSIYDDLNSLHANVFELKIFKAKEWKDLNKKSSSDDSGSLILLDGNSTSVIETDRDNKMTLLKALALHGGLKETSSKWALIIRRQNHKNVVIFANVKNLYQFGDLSENIEVAANDVILVPSDKGTWAKLKPDEWTTILGYFGGVITWEFAVDKLNMKSS